MQGLALGLRSDQGLNVYFEGGFFTCFSKAHFLGSFRQYHGTAKCVNMYLTVHLSFTM
jgi:hypothetical protein